MEFKSAVLNFWEAPGATREEDNKEVGPCIPTWSLLSNRSTTFYAPQLIEGRNPLDRGCLSCFLFFSSEFSMIRAKALLRGQKNKRWKFSSVQSLSCIQLFATPWITACQASLSITNSRSSPKLMFMESVMPSSHLILCHPLLLLPPIPPSIRVFSDESTLRMRWPSIGVSALASVQSFQRTPRTDLL